MDGQIMLEVWQAYSTLSDAQDLLDTDVEAARGRIEHAKAHLQVLIDKTEAESPEILRSAVMAAFRCSLEDGG